MDPWIIESIARQLASLEGADPYKVVATLKERYGEDLSGMPEEVEPVINQVIQEVLGQETPAPSATPSAEPSEPPPGTPKPTYPIDRGPYPQQDVDSQFNQQYGSKMQARPFGNVTPGEMTALESQYYFPYLGGEGDEHFATGNVLQNLGLRRESGSPWVEFMANMVQPLFLQEQLKSALGGETLGPTANATLADRVSAAMREGRTSSFDDPQAILTQLADLGRQAATSGYSGMPKELQQLLAMINNPEGAAGTYATVMGPHTSPFLRRGMKGALLSQLEDYRRSAPTGSPLDFLLR